MMLVDRSPSITSNSGCKR